MQFIIKDNLKSYFIYNKPHQQWKIESMLTSRRCLLLIYLWTKPFSIFFLIELLGKHQVTCFIFCNWNKRNKNKGGEEH